MSLNRCEDALLAYLRDRPDEKRFWTERVLEIDRVAAPREFRASQLDRELRSYVAERTEAEPALSHALGTGAVSMRNLAEYLLATWTPPRGPRTQTRR